MSSLFNTIVQNRLDFVKSKYKPIQLFRKAIEGKRIGNVNKGDIVSVIEICKEHDKAKPKKFFDDVVEQEARAQALFHAYEIRRAQMNVRLKAVEHNFKKEQLIT